jgi:LDH2 family malate/lactate/ureidoglycolate dehydrogenase
MDEPDKTRFIPHQTLLEFCANCFERLGLTRADAEVTADNLIFANLRGVDSHGIIRLKIYADRLRAGGNNPKARPSIVRDSETSALIDADNGVGQVAAVQAMKLAIDKAGRFGIGVTGVKNSNHFGAAAYYAMMATRRDMIGFALTNASPTMAPAGGREARLGNNPFAVAVPAGDQPPLVLDMASGAVAKGKIFVAQQEKKKIPLTWALDKNGVPTDDPDKAAEGLIQPLGGYKGYGISLMLDILTGVLCGSGFATHVGMMYGSTGEPTGTGHSFGALRVDCFIDPDEFKHRVDETVELMRSCPRAPGVERIYVPGEIELAIQQTREAQGIPISPALMDDLAAVGRDLGVDLGF